MVLGAFLGVAKLEKYLFLLVGGEKGTRFEIK